LVAREEFNNSGQPAIAVLPWIIELGVNLFDLNLGKKFSGSLACQA
jgi:inactivated superfamily I helicase